jgi:hypothetical protein
MMMSCFPNVKSMICTMLLMAMTFFNAWADEISFEFTATVTEVHRNLTSMAGIVGQTGMGRVTYDLQPAMTAYYSQSQLYGYESPPASFEFTIGGHTYTAGTEAHTPVSAIDSDVQVDVGNNRLTWPNTPESDRIRYWGLWTGETIDSHEFSMELILNDQTSTLLDDTSLPTQCPDLADFDPYPTTQFVFMIAMSDTTSTSGITFRVDSITPISNPEARTLTLTIPTSAVEGDGVLTGLGQVGISPAPDVDLAVNLHSGDPSEVAVPATITIAANQTSATFDLTVVDDTLDDGAQSVSVTASSDIYGSSTQTISIEDDDPTPPDGDDDDGEDEDDGGDEDDGDPVAFDLTGTWRVTEVADESDCGEGVNTKQYTVTLTQNGNSLSVQTPYGNFNGRLDGQVATWSGTGSEDGGTLVTRVAATLNAEGTSFTGSETWRWSGDGGFQCSGTSELSANLGADDDGSGSSGGGGGCFLSILGGP